MKRNQKHHLRPYVGRLLALLACLALTMPGIPPAAAADNQTVRAGVFFFDGYHMRDDDGTYSGYGIELLSLISQYSHLNFEFTGYDNTWQEMQSMLLDGEIDVVTSARKTRERTEHFLFSLPIDLNNTILSVQAGNTKLVSGDYSTYDGMTVGMLAGNSQNRFLPEFAEENGFTYQTREFKDNARMEAALQRGDIDAILTSNLRRTENERRLEVIKVDYFYAITRKEDQELMDEINYAITQMNLYEGDWANILYNKYYGISEISSAGSMGFTQRELDYIETVVSGEKRITAMSMPNRRPYSYVEDGELRGILPQFFDRLMEMAGLPYEMVVPADAAEYERLKESGAVDVIIDWHQVASQAVEYIEGGFLTNSYMSTGTVLVTRKDFSGPISTLAILEGLIGMPLDYEPVRDARIKLCVSPEEVAESVLDRSVDAAFMRTYSAQYYSNNDSTNLLQMSTIDSDQIVFNMYIPQDSDHELLTILNKCMQQAPEDVLRQLTSDYTASTPENVSIDQYLAAHPGTVLSLFSLFALAVGVIIYFYQRSRWNNRLFRTTEQSKRELEEQLAIVNALSRDYVTVYKLDLREDTIQAMKLEGYTPSSWNWERGETVAYTETLFRYMEGRVPDNDKDDLRQMLSLERVKEALSAGPEYSGSFRIRVREEIHNFQFNCVAYHAEGQAESRVLLGFRNIDEIIRKEQKQREALKDALHMAQAASEAKTAFLSNISHDIRTPMNAIIGFLTLMRNEAENPDTVREYVQQIDAASQHLLGLINDVLDMSRIESGSTTLSLTEIELGEIITEINTIIQTQVQEKRQTFEVFASHLNFEHLMGDKTRINQILINLLSNSVKYTPEGGMIELRVEELPQVVANYSRIRFTVRDNGLGMSEEYQKILFDPFTREETGVTREIQGTGLGMPITKSLVDLMGGTIKVDSRPGEGSTFTVELELRIVEKEDDLKFWSDYRIARMIVVDDDEEACRNVVKAMSGAGVPVDYATECGDGVQMVRRAQEAGKPYDLILLDWKMPGLGGLETARLIREFSKTPILLLTAYNWRDIEQQATGIGVNHFMPKPFFMSTFKEAVRLMMGLVNDAGRQETDMFNGMRVLVVDDIEVNRLILVKILSTLNARCDTAAGGQEAVDKFLDDPSGYDLILMDVQMPGMNGYETTRVIRASGHPLANAVPIIALTANAFVDDVREAIDSGMDAHIAKPIQIDKLKDTIQQVIESRAEKHP